MGTDVDWQHELDSSFGTGHDLPPGHYVAAGRTAVRRRRRATALVLAASLLVAGSAAWATAPDPSTRGGTQIATQGPTPDRDGQRRERRDVTPPKSQPTMTVEEEFLGEPATIDVDGTLKLSPLTDEVLQRVPNPMGYGPAEGRSFGLRVIYQGLETYALIAGSADGTSTSMHSNSATGDFPGWLADKVSLQRGLDVANGDTSSDLGILDTPGEWLTVGPEGGIVSASPFVAVTEVRDRVDLGAGFAQDTDRTGVARLQVAGEQELVAWRVIAGGLDVVRGPGRFDSLDAFVTWARGQYASGEGMR